MVTVAAVAFYAGRSGRGVVEPDATAPQAASAAAPAGAPARARLLDLEAGDHLMRAQFTASSKRN